jgi:hypothetical protein
LQQYYPSYERQSGPGDRRPRFRRPPWLFWLLLALALPLVSYLLGCAVQGLISLVLLFWLVANLCVQLLAWWFGPYLLPIGLCVLVFLLSMEGRGTRDGDAQPKDGD